MKVRAQQGDTLDALCQRHYGRTVDVTEIALEANRDLARLGTVLPHGQLVELPDAPAATAHQTVKLWE